MIYYLCCGRLGYNEWGMSLCETIRFAKKTNQRKYNFSVSQASRFLHRRPSPRIFTQTRNLDLLWAGVNWSRYSKCSDMFLFRLIHDPHHKHKNISSWSRALAGSMTSEINLYTKYLPQWSKRRQMNSRYALGTSSMMRATEQHLTNRFSRLDMMHSTQQKNH